ncbi:glycosyltransferase family 2 protein [Senegalia massiliensis]|uniref:glycosyltransferase family 2 protein n=1 Tax=Senegalia massiliensis TaxID=1720316 RepID=UPI001F5E47C0|nr:glycosyltransferase family 2 protein [Senegalia massiliensis]
MSIITPVYNAEKLIDETINSVLIQTYKDFEMILIDDCSTDSSRKVIKKYTDKDKRIKYSRLDKNSGAAVARNKGIELATGRYICFLDSDDLWTNTKLEEQLNFMKNKDIAFSFTSYSLINEEGKDLNKIVTAPKKIDYEGLLKNTIIGCLTVMIDREKVGDFRMPLVRAGQDTATWLSILKKGHIAYGLQKPLAKYRIVKGSISHGKIKALKRTWNTYRNLEKLSLSKSIYVFIFYVFNAIKKRI